MNHRSVGLLSIGHLVVDVNQGALPALLPFLIAEHHLSYAAAAGIVFAANIASTVIQPLFGYGADRFNKPWLLPIGLVMAGLGLALAGFLASYWLIIAAAVVSGIGVAAFHPEAARLVNFAAKDKTATAMSFFGVGGTLGFALGPLLATAAVGHWGLVGTWTLIVPVSVVALIIAVRLPALSALSATRDDHPRISRADGRPDAWGPFARLTLMVIGRSVLFYGLLTFIPLYWIKVLHQSEAAGGTALFVMAASGVVGNILGGRLADRIGQPKVLLAGFCLLIPLLPALIWVSSAPLALGLLVPIGLAISATYSPAIVTGQRYLPRHVGFSSGITLGVAVAIGGVAAPLLGKIADLHGLRSALVAIVFLPVVMAGLTLTLPDPQKLSARLE